MMNIYLKDASVYCKAHRGIILLVGYFFLTIEVLAHINPVATVTSVKGSVFATNGKVTKSLRPGDHLDKFSEVLSSTGGRLGFSDFFDNRYILAESGHIRLEKGKFQLREGFLLIQSGKSKRTSVIQTPNAKVIYKGEGDGIVSFNTISGKTQLFVEKGRLHLRSMMEPVTRYVDAGHFSFVHKDYDRGRPRLPTMIGGNSYQVLTGLFDDHFSPQSKSSRNIASLSPEKGKLLSFSHQKIQGSSRPAAGRIVIRIFGRKNKDTRVPASQLKSKKPKKKLENRSEQTVKKQSPANDSQRGPSSISSDPFETALREEYKKQLNQPDDVKALIRDLKSYKAPR